MREQNKHAPLERRVAKQTVHETGAEEIAGAGGVLDVEALERLLLHARLTAHGDAPFIPQGHDGELAPLGQLCEGGFNL